MASESSARGINRRDLLTGLTVSLAGSLGGTARSADTSTSVSPGTASCVLTPVTSEGPYYFDPKLIRSAIAEHEHGVPLTLDLRVVTVSGCSAIRNARVDVWHSNSRGIYSGYESQRGVGDSADRSAAGQTFLRGTQLTDRDGITHFRTIYPSWYYGRTPHIHFKVFLQPREVAVSQIFFPDTVSDRIFASSQDYIARSRGRDTYNENDMYARSGRTGGAFCDVAPAGTGYRASVLIGIRDA
jgi:protocatechuate 3,4-dioxygenase beta subunit